MCHGSRLVTECLDPWAPIQNSLSRTRGRETRTKHLRVSARRLNRTKDIIITIVIPRNILNFCIQCSCIVAGLGLPRIDFSSVLCAGLKENSSNRPALAITANHLKTKTKKVLHIFLLYTLTAILLSRVVFTMVLTASKRLSRCPYSSLFSSFYCASSVSASWLRTSQKHRALPVCLVQSLFRDTVSHRVQCPSIGSNLVSIFGRRNKETSRRNTPSS